MPLESDLECRSHWKIFHSRAEETMRAVLEPTSDEVLIEEADIDGLDAKVIRDLRISKVGMAFQNMALLQHSASIR